MIKFILFYTYGTSICSRGPKNIISDDSKGIAIEENQQIQKENNFCQKKIVFIIMKRALILLMK